ncbi:MAG: glycoside hydrolase family 127 protein [bacterium]|nr:glycoside hydrolase family 127 protein [bacterium]
MFTNRKPLIDIPFIELPLGSIKPEGWLRNQLTLQANGLTGHLDEIWESVGPNSGWLGGSGENWERGPYYCDGLIPLAHLLNDEKLIEKAQKWIEWSLNSQTEEGNFGPQNNLDWWPRMVMLKAFIQYYEAKGDDRVIEFMKRYFLYQRKYIEKRPLESWAMARGAENIYSIYWLYNITGDEFLLDLAEIIFKQTLDWTDIFINFPYTRPIKFYYDWAKFKDLKFHELINYHSHHVVNVAMGIKYPALYYQLTGEEKHRRAVGLAIDNLTKYHGVASGMFTGDEHLSGRNPSQGTELCAVVEYMFSLQNVIKISEKNIRYVDLLEKVAYNALPATFTEDMCAHQYDQQVNQVLVSIAKRDWYNNNDDSNIFGLEPNFGCCTANMHQGWPKFVKNLWFATLDGGLSAVVYAPNTVDTEINGTDVSIKEETDYPFNENIKFTIKCQRRILFPLRLRIPLWCDSPEIKVNGRQFSNITRGKYYKIIKEWEDGDTVELRLPMKIRTNSWFNNSVSIERGPLVFALRLEEERKKIKGNDPFNDWEIYPKSPWNYALVLDNENPDESFSVEVSDVPFQPFNSTNPPVLLKGRGIRVKEWILENNSAGILPISPVDVNSSTEEIILIPYGGAKLRIAQFPYTSK